MVHLAINVLLTSTGWRIYNLFSVRIPLGQVMYSVVQHTSVGLSIFKLFPFLSSRGLRRRDCSDI
jgi:hypothetical protein